MVAAGVVAMSRAMVGSAMLAIALSSTAMETAIASVAMARRRAAGGRPSARSIRGAHQASSNAAHAHLTLDTPTNKLANPANARSCDAPAANRRFCPLRMDRQQRSYEPGLLRAAVRPGDRHGLRRAGDR